MSKIDYDKLKKIEKPWGLLNKQERDALKAVWNRKEHESNIQYVNSIGSWRNGGPIWAPSTTYRLDPEWQPPEEKPKRELVVCDVHQPAKPLKGLHFFLGSYSYEAIMFCERDDIPGYAGVRYEWMAEGVFTKGDGGYVYASGEPVIATHVTEEALRDGTIRPAKPLQVAFIKEAK